MLYIFINLYIVIFFRNRFEQKKRLFSCHQDWRNRRCHFNELSSKLIISLDFSEQTSNFHHCSLSSNLHPNNSPIPEPLLRPLLQFSLVVIISDPNQLIQVAQLRPTLSRIQIPQESVAAVCSFFGAPPPHAHSAWVAVSFHQQDMRKDDGRCPQATLRTMHSAYG